MTNATGDRSGPAEVHLAPGSDRPGRSSAVAGTASTAAVLWLMILLVFLPIAGAHGLARLWEHEGGEPHGSLAQP